MGKKKKKAAKQPEKASSPLQESREELKALLCRHHGGIQCLPTAKKVLGTLETMLLNTLSLVSAMDELSDDSREILTSTLNVCAQINVLGLVSAASDLERFTERLVAKEKPPH